MALQFQPTEKDQFYPVDEEKIVWAEKEMGLEIPSDLKEFYRKFGYGFVGDCLDVTNRLMDPVSVTEFRTKTGIYGSSFQEIDTYDASTKDKLIFFEVDSFVAFSIGLENQKIYSGNNVIAESLDDFLYKMEENPFYYRVLYDETGRYIGNL